MFYGILFVKGFLHSLSFVFFLFYLCVFLKMDKLLYRIDKDVGFIEFKITLFNETYKRCSDAPTTFSFEMWPHIEQLRLFLYIKCYLVYNVATIIRDNYEEHLFFFHFYLPSIWTFYITLYLKHF